MCLLLPHWWYPKDMWKDCTCAPPTPNPTLVKVVPAVKESGQSSSLQTVPCQETDPLRPCPPFPFPSSTSAGPRQENGVGPSGPQCKINTHTLNGKMQFKIQWLTGPFYFLKDHSTSHFITLRLIIETAGDRPCTVAWNTHFRWKTILVSSFVKQNLPQQKVLMCSLCVFQMKDPQNKGDSLPKPEPRALWGGEDTGTGVCRMAGSGAERAALSASGAPWFWAEVLCLQPKPDWRIFFMSKWDAGSHPLSVCWAKTTTASLVCMAAAHNAQHTGSRGIMPWHSEEEQQNSSRSV